MLSDLSPFAAASFAAGLKCGFSPFSMLGGAALYACLAFFSIQSLLNVAACVLIALIDRALVHFLPSKKADCLRDVLLCFEAGTGVLLPGLAASFGLPYNIATTLLSAMLAALLAPALTDALGLDLSVRRRFLPEEQLSAALLTVTLIISMVCLPYWGTQIAQTFAVFVTLIMATRGAALGAVGGLACGTALALGTGIPTAGSALALGGLLAGCACRLPRVSGVLALAAGNALALSYGIGYTLGAVDLIPLMIGGTASCLLPKPFLRRIQLFIAPPPLQPASSGQNDGIISERLDRLSRVFTTLADGYRTESPPDESQMIRILRDALCTNCTDYKRCWQGDHPEAGRLMCRLLSEALCQGTITPLTERPPDLVRHCRRSSQIDARLGPLLTELSAKHRLFAEKSAMQSLVSNQFRQAAAFLSDAALSVNHPFSADSALSASACAALERSGIPAQCTVLRQKAAYELRLHLKSGIWTPPLVQSALHELTKELKKPLSVALRHNETLILKTAPLLKIRTGVSLHACQDNAPCGDTIYAGLLPGGQFMIVLSDGMGSGPRAAAESRRTVRLIRTFLEAELDSTRSLEAINALLQTGGGELFATVDLCLIDLQNGQAVLSKLGACSSLLISGGRITELSGGHLPIGILESVTPGTVRFAVHPGDMLIFHSDGIADDLREDHSLWLRQKVLASAALEPKELAEALRLAAVERDGGQAADDMGVIVVKIEARTASAKPSEAASPEAKDFKSGA